MNSVAKQKVSEKSGKISKRKKSQQQCEINGKGKNYKLRSFRARANVLAIKIATRIYVQEIAWDLRAANERTRIELVIAPAVAARADIMSTDLA